jgi:hypothetical protein
MKLAVVVRQELVCDSGCEIYPNYKKCPLNKICKYKAPDKLTGEHIRLLQDQLSVAGRCKVRKEQREHEAIKRREERELEEKTCPDCGSTNSKIVISIPRGEAIIGGTRYCDCVRQCKDCKNVW